MNIFQSFYLYFAQIFILSQMLSPAWHNKWFQHPAFSTKQIICSLDWCGLNLKWIYFNKYLDCQLCNAELFTKRNYFEMSVMITIIIEWKLTRKQTLVKLFLYQKYFCLKFHNVTFNNKDNMGDLGICENQRARIGHSYSPPLLI